MSKKSKNDGINLCIVPDCDRTVRSRGMCDVHYTYTSVLVNRGKYTWEALEKAGRTLPKKHRHTVSPLRDWLDGGDK